MAFKMPKVTNAGKKLLAKVLAGESLEFTRFKMGDGNLSDTNPDNLNNLINTVVSVNVSKISQGENFISVRGEFTNQGIEVGFYWREYGLFAQDPDEGEVLFAYSNAGEIADYIPPSTESDIARTLVSTISLSNASSITIIFDDSMVFATKEELDKINEVLAAVIGDPPNGSIVVTLLHEKSGSIHQFTGLNGRTGLIPCQFKSTAGYTEGDTATIDGTAYTITLTGADAPETDLFVSGKSILIDVDTEGKLINFKAGGGLTKAKLALADATEDTVFNGKTFYAGSKVLRTGRALATPTTVTAKKMFKGIKAYNDKGQLVTGAPTVTSATAGDIVAGKTAYDNEGNLIKGTRLAGIVQYGYFPKAGEGLVAPGDTGNHENTFTASWDSSLGYPKQFIAWFDTWAPYFVNNGTPQQFTNPSFSPYLNRGSITGTLGGTTTVSGTHQFRNQNQSYANSTVYVSSSYARFTVSYYDHAGNNDLCWIALW